ncbi:MAG TPA: malate synthase G [Ilumatobacteraceae bacterium]
MTASSYVDRAGLQVGVELADVLEREALPASGVDAERFWNGLAELFEDFGPRNTELLEVRATMQAAIDRWYREHTNALDGDAQPASTDYRDFLEEIGYLVPSGPPFAIETEATDPEITSIAGPQLVVPVSNARYAINAANARWGSLYDALYGTDALGDPPVAGPYDAARGARVVAWVRRFLDDVVPLAVVEGSQRSHAAVTAYMLADGALTAAFADGSRTGLAEPAAFIGYTGEPDEPASVLLEHHRLGIEIVIDHAHPIGSTDLAGVADVVLESALTSIMDFEDSIAAVDSADKALAYHNWLGLMTGTLTEEVTKNGTTFTRRLAPGRTFTGPDGSASTRPGLALMLVRNVGHLMTTPAILGRDGNPVYEGLLDAMVTVLCAMPRVAREPAGSAYVVKPKMHGPAEVAFIDDVFSRVESVLGLPANTVKIGIMDEERRTTVNLAECIRAAKSRVAFINTGFLDRTGDEIHTSMLAGPMVRKSEMRTQRWIKAYEDWNVDTGITCGLPGRAQIGKGMWAAPDLMADMLEQKVQHPLAGANCAWVPSPTAATLHATHYHRVDVAARQRELAAALAANGPRASLDDLLDVPVGKDRNWSAADRQAELDNNAQGILGYVVRWVDQGIGCSKVPDIRDVALMEDRATCRISSQHIANWLLHEVVSRDDVMATMRRMATVVDQQNADDPAYRPMAPEFDGPAFNAACDLVFSGVEQPSGYTEPILHARRLERKRLGY